MRNAAVVAAAFATKLNGFYVSFPFFIPLMSDGSMKLWNSFSPSLFITRLFGVRLRTAFNIARFASSIIIIYISVYFSMTAHSSMRWRTYTVASDGVVIHATYVRPLIAMSYAVPIQFLLFFCCANRRHISLSFISFYLVGNPIRLNFAPCCAEVAFRERMVAFCIRQSKSKLTNAGQLSSTCVSTRLSYTNRKKL